MAITSTHLPHVWEMLIRQLIQNPVRLLGKGTGGEAAEAAEEREYGGLEPPYSLSNVLSSND